MGWLGKYSLGMLIGIDWAKQQVSTPIIIKPIIIKPITVKPIIIKPIIIKADQ